MRHKHCVVSSLDYFRTSHTFYVIYNFFCILWPFYLSLNSIYFWWRKFDTIRILFSTCSCMSAKKTEGHMEIYRHGSSKLPSEKAHFWLYTYIHNNYKDGGTTVMKIKINMHLGSSTKICYMDLMSNSGTLFKRICMTSCRSTKIHIAYLQYFVWIFSTNV